MHKIHGQQLGYRGNFVSFMQNSQQFMLKKTHIFMAYFDNMVHLNMLKYWTLSNDRLLRWSLNSNSQFWFRCISSLFNHLEKIQFFKIQPKEHITIFLERLNQVQNSYEPKWDLFKNLNLRLRELFWIEWFVRILCAQVPLTAIPGST